MLYASIKNLDAATTDLFVEVISAMDEGYLAWCAANRPKQTATPPTGGERG